MGEATVGISVDTEKESFGRKINLFKSHRARMFVITLFSDLTAIIISTILVHLLMYGTFFFNYLSMSEFEHILFLVICMSLFMTTRLYPGIGLNPALEIKTVTQLNVITFLIVFCFLLIRAPFWTPEKLALILISIFSIFTVLGMRWLMRIMFVQIGLWGEPVVVVGSFARVQDMIDYFHARRRLGFLPIVGGVEEAGGRSGSAGVQMMDLNELLQLPDGYFLQRSIQTVLVSTLSTFYLSESKANRDLLRKFKHMIFVSDMDWLEGASLSYHDFEGMIGIEARQNLLAPVDIFIKRTMDILLSSLMIIFSLPLLALTALLIRLDSPGPIFYVQERIGRNGGRILIKKFRSMRPDADQVLAEYLASNPTAFSEWEKTQKLRHDPRVTAIGRWIRKFSIDELPQLFNIFMGDMSLVGPRPIIMEQRELYGEGIDAYTSVRPGLTGFWQVSGRNNTSFSQRAIYDMYYVRNWSIWLDIYILLRTIWVVLSRDGAY